MIITRSPLRISFAGGGTDIPAFYKPYGPGAVVSTSISRYVYVTLNRKFDGKVSVRYRIHENVDHVSELKHPLIRECILNYGIENGVEIVIASEVPARGSGLGASSALASALCLALERFKGNSFAGVGLTEKKYIAGVAAQIEIDRCGAPIGKQDHYASAVGGLNFLKFHSDDTVEISRYVRNEFTEELEGQSMLFYLDMEHEYHGGHFVQKILKDQVAEVDAKKNLHRLQRDNAFRLWEHMDYAVIERFQDHVNENWRLKREMHRDISNPKIDQAIQTAYEAGAVAAKVCGAGGGGFLYLIVPPSMQDSVRDALRMHELRFAFEEDGVQCLFEQKGEYASVKG